MIAVGLVAVTRLRAGDGGRDQYGEAVPGPVVETSLPPALFNPGGTSEPVTAGSLPVVSQPTLYWRNKHPDIRSSDLLRIAGTTYRVEGAPARWPKGTVVTLHAATDPKTTGGA